MQTELDEAVGAGSVSIFGLNATGLERANESFTKDADLPWLQDVQSQDVWNTWAAAYRDVVILDADSIRTHLYNLTYNDLDQADNYDALKDQLLKLAGQR